MCSSDLQQLGDFVQASESYRRALALRPDYHEARNNLGNVLGELGCWSEATEHFQHLLTLPLDHAPIYNNLGRALLNKRRIGDAVSAYRCALELNPAHVAAHSNLLFALNHDPDLGPEELFAEHRRWAAAHASSMEISGPDERFAGAAERRLRIGYVSGDFWDHAVCASFELLLTEPLTLADSLFVTCALALLPGLRAVLPQRSLSPNDQPPSQLQAQRLPATLCGQSWPRPPRPSDASVTGRPCSSSASVTGRPSAPASS